MGNNEINKSLKSVENINNAKNAEKKVLSQESLICTMEVAEAIGEIHNQQEIISEAMHSINEQLRRIGMLNSSMNRNLNKVCK